MPTLNDIELRVLGVLIEKALAVPDSYPMTLNSITTGANQKQNREPVTSYGEGDVSAALRSLQHRNLVTQAPPSYGARAVRFQHAVVDVFHWDRREQAVMAELMLRGRQTPGELRTHASRMVELPDLAAVQAILDALRSGDRAFVEELPREPGRSANRFRHLLSGDTALKPIAVNTTESASGGILMPLEESEGSSSLADRVARLEAEVADLKAILAAKAP